MHKNYGAYNTALMWFYAATDSEHFQIVNNSWLLYYKSQSSVTELFVYIRTFHVTNYCHSKHIKTDAEYCLLDD